MKKNYNKINVYIMGKKYKVTEGITLQKAMEEAGYKLLRGCGCRGGFCGACGTLYRLPGSFKLRVGLACQTIVSEGMIFAGIPFFPANKANYNIEQLEFDLKSIVPYLYPEVLRCIQCNACTKICPQDIKVMDYIACAIKGDIEGLAKKSFDCVMCGLCALRCPAEMVQYNIALLGRRVYAKYFTKKAHHIEKRVSEIEEGLYDEGFKKIMGKTVDELKKIYKEKDTEE